MNLLSTVGMKHSNIDIPFPLSCAIQKVEFCVFLSSASAERRTKNLKTTKTKKCPLQSTPPPPTKEEEEEEEEGEGKKDVRV